MRLLGTLAGRQYGVVSRAQSAASGVGRGPVERRLASVAGYAVLRFTHADLARRSSQVARQIRLVLAER